MLRHFLFVSQVSDAIAHTFNSVLWYVGNLSKDKIWQETRPIQRGRALSFDGVDDYVQLPNATAFNLVDFSISAWFKATSKENTRIFSKDNIHDWPVRKLIALKPANIWTNKPFWWILIWLQSIFVESPNSLVVWWTYHISMTRKDWEYLRLYIDWILVDEELSTTFFWPIDSNIWPTIWNYKSNDSIWEYFNSDIRDVRVYNKVKTDAERQNIMNGNSDADGLVWQYKTDEWSWTIWYDSSWNWLHGTLVNWVSHITKTDWFGSDFQNQVWYTDNAGMLIPRDESNITQDVQWNPLQFNWRVKYDARLYGRYMSFDGVDDYVTRPNIFANDTLITAWIRVPSTSLNINLLFEYSIWSLRYWFFLRWNKISYVKNYTFRTSIETIAANQWYHITLDLINNKMYLNNIELTLGSTSWALPSDIPNTIRLWSSTVSWYHGLGNMYDVRVYNTLKTQIERQNIMNWEIDINGLLLQYKLDEWSWTIAYDSSWNWHHGTLINWVSQWEWPQWSVARQTRGHTQSWFVSIPRDESNITKDVLGDDLQYPWDNKSLLPWWRVDHNPWLAPELIRRTVPTDYDYWDTLPATMTKVTGGNKERDFIIKI